MIRSIDGDLLEADAEALVNPVNCVGVMGKGLALQFKKAFRKNFEAYAAACRRDEVEPGRMFVFDTERLINPRYVINFPTKRHWRDQSRLEDIQSGLVALSAEVRDRGIRSVAIPRLGSGLGGLDWSEVRPLIEEAMARAGLARPGLMPPTDTSEAGLERLICTALTGAPCDPPKPGQAQEVAEATPSYEGTGWICGDPRHYDREDNATCSGAKRMPW